MLAFKHKMLLFKNLLSMLIEFHVKAVQRDNLIQNCLRYMTPCLETESVILRLLPNFTKNTGIVEKQKNVFADIELN